MCGFIDSLHLYQIQIHKHIWMRTESTYQCLSDLTKHGQTNQWMMSGQSSQPSQPIISSFLSSNQFEYGVGRKYLINQNDECAHRFQIASTPAESEAEYESCNQMLR